MSDLQIREVVCAAVDSIADELEAAHYEYNVRESEFLRMLARRMHDEDDDMRAAMCERMHPKLKMVLSLHEQRAQEKQAARDRDAADVAAGRKTAEQVSRDNSLAHGIIDRFTMQSAPALRKAYVERGQALVEAERELSSLREQLATTKRERDHARECAEGRYAVIEADQKRITELEAELSAYQLGDTDDDLRGEFWKNDDDSDLIDEDPDNDVEDDEAPGCNPDLVPCSCTFKEVDNDPDPNCLYCKGTGEDPEFPGQTPPDRCRCAVHDEPCLEPKPDCPTCGGEGFRMWGM
jgi:hypothetical protein